MTPEPGLVPDNTPQDKDPYWANAEGLDLAKEVFKRVELFYRRLPQMRMYKRWVEGWAAYSGLPTQDNPFDVTELAYSGEESESANIQVPHLAALGRHLVAMVVQDRVALDPISVNTDYSSEAQTQVAKGILGYVVKAEGLEKDWYEATEIAVACGMSWKSLEWDPSYGDWIKQPAPGGGPGSILYIDPDTQTPIREGRVVSKVYMPWDVITDLTRPDDAHIWLCTRGLENKFDLAAQNPTVAEEILALEDTTKGWLSQTTNKSTRARGNIESDLIPIFTFYHAPTPACPNGRWARVLSEDLILGDGGLPYDKLPLTKHTAGHVLGSQFGDSPFLHGLGIQKVVDKLASAVASNNLALAKQCLVLPEGATYSPGELAEGLAALYVPPGPNGEMLEPKPLQLTKSAPETYQLWSHLVQALAVITGVSGAISGADPAMQKELSGAAMVFVESQALRFLSGAQASYNTLVESDGTKLIKILQRYARSPKLARIAGKGRQFMMREWSGASFEGFDRVEIQRGNFAQNTLGFRMQIAENLRQGNLLESKEQYFEVLTEGTADPLTEGHVASMLRIKRENEMLGQGMPVRALLTDDHRTDILEHASVLARPDLRDGSPLAETVASAVTAHIQEHIALLSDPANAPLLLVLGQQPIMPPPPPGAPPPGAPPGPPGPPGPPHAGPPPPAGPPHVGPIPGPALPPGAPVGPNAGPSAPGRPGAPMMPRNPGTGQRPSPPPGSSAAPPRPGSR